MFKVDTGAEVTVIAEDLLQALNIKEFQPPSKSLHGPDNKLLSVRGDFQAQLAHNDNECISTCFCAQTYQAQHTRATSHSGFATRKDNRCHWTTSSATISIPFYRLGNTEGDPYHISLKPEAKPSALFTPQNVPLPVLGASEEELTSMESLGVITPV